MKKYLIILSLFLAGCAGPITQRYPDDETLRTVPVYIVSHGWHVGIAVESIQVMPYLPRHSQFPDHKYLMFGWGDRDYYPDRDAGFGVLLKAAFWPTRSVIHVVGTDQSVDRYFSSSTVVEVMVTEQGIEHLGAFLAGQFRYENGTILVAADGLYPNSIFFEAEERYYIPKTSNKWTAKALRSTGYPISTFYAMTSGNVIRQASKHGKFIQK